MSVISKGSSTLVEIQKQVTTFLIKRPILIKICKVVGFSWILLIIRKLCYSSYCKYKKYPPGPVGIPFVGCLLSYADRINFDMYLAKSYGPVAMFPLGPKSNMIFINDPNLTLKHFKNDEFAYRPHVWSTALYGDDVKPSFLIINGKDWSERRKLFYNSLLKITDSKYMTTFVQNNIKKKIVIPSIENAIKHNNGKWYLRDTLRNFTFNTIFGSSFGPNLVKNINDEKYKHFQSLTKTLFDQLLYTILLPIFSDTVYNLFCSMAGLLNIYKDQNVILNEWIEEYIENKKNNKENEFVSYIDIMLNNSNIEREKALADIIISFQAGTFTTAESIELMLMNAAKYPHVQNKIYMELCEIFNNSKDVNIDNMMQLNKAHYLRAFIEECWRLIPHSGLLRVLQKDYRIEFVDKNGNDDYYVLPKGSGIGYNNSCFARNEKYGWKNANNFDINNYLDENNKFIKTSKKTNNDIGFKLSIFGYGARQCPGISLAKKEVIFALSILFYKYKFSGPKGKDDTDFLIPHYFSGLRIPIQSLTVQRR